MSIFDFILKYVGNYFTSFMHIFELRPELKSGYPDYPKSGFTRTILVTENRCPKSGHPNTYTIFSWFWVVADEHYFRAFFNILQGF